MGSSAFIKFVRFRYKNAIAHEWDPADPLRVAKHTNEMALRDPLLAAVPVKPLIATCAKSHLQSWLQALKSGAVYWDDTGELMVPPRPHAVADRSPGERPLL